MVILTIIMSSDASLNISCICIVCRDSWVLYYSPLHSIACASGIQLPSAWQVDVISLGNLPGSHSIIVWYPAGFMHELFSELLRVSSSKHPPVIINSKCN